MDSLLKSYVSEMRRKLKNPYAYSECMVQTEHETALLARQITESRKLHEDPYAYLDGHGGYSAIPSLNIAQGVPREYSSNAEDARTSGTTSDKAQSCRYSNREIEKHVKGLHSRLWKDRMSLWRSELPTDPIKILDPKVALGLFGYEYSLEEGLGQYRNGNDLIEVAGLIDRDSKKVHVSRQFDPNVQAFTAAHELGHAVLHPAGGGIHRDRPMDGTSYPRKPEEIEADKFATYFLMPAKLVRTRFFDLFGAECFTLSEGTAFALIGMSLQEIRTKCNTLRDLSQLLASTERYNNRYFVALATQFRVSMEAMAIRLEELKLLRHDN